MADQVKDGETPEEPKVAGETPDTKSEGETFDEARAMELIRKLRAENKDLPRVTKRLKELEDLEAQRAQEELSESEKAKQLATKAQQEAETARAALVERTLRYEFMLAAMRPGSGIEPTAAEAAWKLLDHESIELDEHGEPKEIGKALKELVRQYPFLAAKTTNPAPNINANEAGRGDNKTDPAKVDELKRRFRL